MDSTQTTNQPTQPEHETHTTALVFLVLATVIISYVVLSWDTDISSIMDDRTSTTTEESATPDDVRTHGSLTPQQAVELTDSSSLAGFPQDIYINEDAIIGNHTANAGSGSQYIVVFTDQQPVTELEGQYRSYLEESGFSIAQAIEDEYGAKLVGRADGRQLTVSITENGATSRVMIDYVTAS